MARDWTRTYVEQRAALDIRAFQAGRDGRVNLLKEGSEFVWHAPAIGRVAWIRVETDWAEIRYQIDDGGRQISRALAITVTRTTCNLGSTRAWWICPACSARVAILYRWGVFHCRKCANLHYQSQSETAADRTLRRAGKLRSRLGWEPGVVNPRGGKPAGMHWRTYYQLHGRCHAEEVKALGNLETFLGRFRRAPIQAVELQTPTRPEVSTRLRKVKVSRTKPAKKKLIKPLLSGDNHTKVAKVQCRDCANVSAGFRCLIPDSGQTYPVMSEWRRCSNYVALADS